MEGQTLSVYKLFDLTVSDDGSNYAYTVNENFKEGIINALGMTSVSPEPDSAALYEKLSEMESDGTEIQNFANSFTTYALTNSPTATKSSGKISTAETSYTFEDLDFGYYLVYQTGTEKLQSSLVTVDDAETATPVELKGETPSITKEADKETVQIGQIVTYTITGTIPDTTGYDTYTYKIHDTLTDGLDFVTEDGTAATTSYSVKVQITGEAEETQNATITDRTMTLDLSTWVRDADNQAHKGETFTVTYYAKVNSSAVVTTKNSASLEYGNDPDNTTTTTPVEVKTPTYPLQIHKMAEGAQTGDATYWLTGATFRIYKTENDATNGTNPIVVTGGNGSYTVAESQTGTTYDMVSANAQIGTNTGYNLVLNGLAAGNYWLVETEAPDGYNGLTAPVKITITKSATDDVNEWTISKNDAAEDDKIIDIENSTGTLLPSTGGMGTILFTAVGVVLIVAIAGSFVMSRRKRK